MGRLGKKKSGLSLFILILISGIVFTSISFIGSFGIYKEYDARFMKEPMLSIMFKAMGDGTYPWKIRFKQKKSNVEIVQEVIVQDSLLSPVEEMEEERMDIPKDIKPSTELNQNQLKEETNPTEEKKKNQNEDVHRKEKKDSKQQETKNLISLGEVNQEYFNDVLFIGDSRTVGLSEYSYLTNATYYCDVGLSVYTVFDKKIAKVNGKKVTLEKALKKNKFKKIYIMLGINEIGTGTPKTFAAKYQEVIERIRKFQPEAYIVIEAIMKLGKKLSDKDEIFNNTNVVKRNEAIAKLADGEMIFYLDVNDVLTDDDGYLPEESTFDSIHLLAKYYNVWADFLIKNGLQSSI